MTKLEQEIEKRGWELVKTRDDQKSLPISEISLSEFVHQFEEYATWDVMLKRAETISALFPQQQAELLLKEQAVIPESWRTFNIVFPGTIWKSVTGELHCPFLRWNGEAWCFDFYWFAYDFHHNDRFITKAK